MKLTTRLGFLWLLCLSGTALCDNPATPSCNGCVLNGETVASTALPPLCESCVSDAPVSGDLPPLCESCVVESELDKPSESQSK